MSNYTTDPHDLSLPGVYGILCIPRNRLYIGSTTTPISKRWTIHRTDLRHLRHPVTDLQIDFMSYGEDAFEVRTLWALPHAGRLAILNCEQLTLNDYRRAGWWLYNTNEAHTRPRISADHLERGLEGFWPEPEE